LAISAQSNSNNSFRLKCSRTSNRKPSSPFWNKPFKRDLILTDEYDIYARLEAWGFQHKTVNHSAGEYARDDDGDGFYEVHVNTMEGFWSLLRSWLRPHRGLSQELLPIYLAFFEFVHNLRRRGKAFLVSLLAALLAL
jgi:transposase